MKRLIPVFIFTFIVIASFWGILNYAEQREAIKQQDSDIKIETIHVFTDIQTGILEEIGKSFYEENGIQVDVVHVTKEQLLSKEPVQGESADVYLTSQQTLSALKEGKKLKAYSSENTDTILNLFKDENAFWTGLWIDPVVFVVNQEYALKHPDFNYNWTDVMSDNTIRISITDFIASDMSEELLMTLAEHFGTTEAFYLLEQGQTHIVQYGKYLSTPARMASMGKCDIGISSYNEAKKIENEKLPVFILYPTDGVPWYLYGIALSADSKYLDRGERFINWLLNPVRYKGIMKDKGYHYIYINDIGISPDINGTKLKYWELEKKYTDEGKKILLNQWMDKIRFGRSS